MQEYPAGQVEKNGQTVDIYVSDWGSWGARVAGKNLSAETRDKLVEKIATATKQAVVKVEVPFTELGWQGGGYGRPAQIYARQGTATGFHSANGNILVTWSDGSKAQLTDRVLRVAPVSKDEAAEYIRLATAAREVANALSDWESDHRFDLKETVEEAIKEA
jgi:hypothetical protein